MWNAILFYSLKSKNALTESFQSDLLQKKNNSNQVNNLLKPATRLDLQSLNYIALKRKDPNSYFKIEE